MTMQSLREGPRGVNIREWWGRDRIERANFPLRAKSVDYCNNTARRTILDTLEVARFPIKIQKCDVREIHAKATVAAANHAPSGDSRAVDDVHIMRSEAIVTNSRIDKENPRVPSRVLQGAPTDSSTTVSTPGSFRSNNKNKDIVAKESSRKSPFLGHSTPQQLSKGPSTGPVENVSRKPDFTFGVLNLTKDTFHHHAKPRAWSPTTHNTNETDLSFHDTSSKTAFPDTRDGSPCVSASPSLDNVDLSLSELHIATPVDSHSGSSPALSESDRSSPDENDTTVVMPTAEGLSIPNVGNTKGTDILFSKKRRRSMYEQRLKRIMQALSSPEGSPPAPSNSSSAPPSARDMPWSGAIDFSMVSDEEDVPPQKRFKSDHLGWQPSGRESTNAVPAPHYSVKTATRTGPPADVEVIEILDSDEET